MFREVLQIVPRLSSGDATRMEQSLGARFRRVAHRFRSALNFAIKGSLVGISLGLLTRLLNPLEKVLDRTEKLLGQSTELQDLADELGTNVPALLSAQVAAQNLGIKPEDFKKLLESFSQAVEKAREELKNPFATRSETTDIVKNFLSENVLEGFSQFLGSLGAKGRETKLTPQFLSKRAQEKALDLSPSERKKLVASGEIRDVTGRELQEQIEKAIFGKTLLNTRSGENLVENFNSERLKVSNQVGVPALSNAAEKLRIAAEAQNRAEGRNEIQNFIRGGETITPSLVQGLEAGKQREIDQTFNQMVAGKLDDLLKGKETLDQIGGVLLEIQNLVLKLLNGLGNIFKLVPGIESALRKFGGGK